MSRRKSADEPAIPGGGSAEDRLLLAAATTLDRALCALEDPEVGCALGSTRHELTAALRGTVALLFDRLEDPAA